jgi:glycine/D-amino acid oxidase-like deaminating enzyme
MKVDFIIVGQGLAGTLLANELIRKNKSIVVFDDPDQPKASEVAAGIINPIGFRRMIKSWGVDEAFPQMETCYRQLEDFLNERIYFPERMMRILSEDSADSWQVNALANHLESYLAIEPIQNFANKMIDAPSGYGLVYSSGRLDLQKLMSLFSIYLDHKESIRKEKLDFDSLNFNSELVHYKDITSEKIIFCEGPAASQNPYFQKLKFKNSKGEILELKIPKLNLDEIVSGDIFLLPLGEDRYKVGATYSWDELNWKTTVSASDELLRKLKQILSADPEILRQMAGIRPTMHDRKPVIGLLPDNPQIGIFNGLGSKGVLLGPYFAKQFSEYLLGNSGGIHPEVNISRYFKNK